MASLIEIVTEPGVLVLEMCSWGGEIKNEVSAMTVSIDFTFRFAPSPGFQRSLIEQEKKMDYDSCQEVALMKSASGSCGQVECLFLKGG